MSITIGEFYNSESKKRKRIAYKHKLFRLFGYNPKLIAFKRTCAFCLTDLTDDTVEGVWKRSSIFDFSKHVYTEEHRCSCCHQKWSYFNVSRRGIYKFDKR